MGTINVTDLISAKLIAYANHVLISPQTVVCVNLPEVNHLNFPSVKHTDAVACENFLFRDESVDLLIVNCTAEDFALKEFFVSVARILSIKGLAIFAVLDTREHEVAQLLNSLYVLQYSSLHTRIHNTPFKIYFATTMKTPHYLKQLIELSADDAPTVTDNLINFVPHENDTQEVAEAERKRMERVEEEEAENEEENSVENENELTEIEVNDLPEVGSEAMEPPEAPEVEDPEDAEDHLDPEELEEPDENETVAENEHAETEKTDDDELLKIREGDDDDEDEDEHESEHESEHAEIEHAEKEDEHAEAKEHDETPEAEEGEEPEDEEHESHAEHDEPEMHPEHEAVHEAAETSEHAEVRDMAVKLKEHTKILTAHAQSFTKHFSSTAPILQELKNATLTEQVRQSRLGHLQSHYQQHQLLLKQYKNLVGDHEKLLTNFIVAQQKALNTDVDQYEKLIQHHNKLLSDHNDKIREHDDFELRL